MTNNNHKKLFPLLLSLPFILTSCGTSAVSSLVEVILERFAVALPFILIGIFLFVVFVLINDLVVVKLKKIKVIRPFIKIAYFMPVVAYPVVILIAGGPLMYFGMSLLAFGYYAVYFEKINEPDEKIYELKMKNRTNKLNALLGFSGVVFIINMIFSPRFLEDLLGRLL